MASLPGPLRMPRASPFVGRSAELAALRALVPRAPGEGRRVALVSGEAGSGKSRLVSELAGAVCADGVEVLYGACDATVRTPYRPFVEALGQLIRTEDVVPAEELGSAAGELARLLPGLSERFPGLPAPLSADPDTERHRLHTAVTDLLAAAGRHRPLLLVLEDGHWADRASLVLLRHLVRAMADARALVVMTFRDPADDVADELTDALADLRRIEDVVRVRLAGLTDADVGEFVRRQIGGPGQDGHSELAVALRGATDGNPFLLCELWRTLDDAGALAVGIQGVALVRPLDEVATPDGVREVVAQRVTRLGEPARELLELAAAMGGQFDLELLARAAPDAARLLDGLETAVRAGMIEELPGRSRYRFSHELVRRAVYERLGPRRRAELHLRVAAALEDDAAGTAPADLAHHYAAAFPLGPVEKAVEHNLRAARAAAAALAHEEAVERLRTALRMGLRDDRSRLEILLELGRAMFRAGMALDSLAVYREAAVIARRLGDGEMLARVAIGFEEACWRPGLTDQGARELLEEALEGLSHDTELRVGVLAGLARALEFQGSAVQAEHVRAQGVAMARRIGDRRGLARVLSGTYWGRPATSPDAVLAHLDEAVALAEELGDIEIQAESRGWRVAVHLARGEVEQARRDLRRTREMAENTRQPFILHVVEQYASALALLEGRLDEAERSAERSREWAKLLIGRDPSGVYGVQMFGVRREQGRLAELAPVMRVLVARGRPGGPWRPGLVAVLAELGMRDEVVRELEEVCAGGLAPYRSSLWLASLTFLADAAAIVGHRQTARLLLEELAPLTGTTIMIGHGVACYGAADRYLGMLNAVLGNGVQAREQLAAALALNRRMGARTWEAHSAWHLACVLRDEDPLGAEALLRRAATLAQEIGMAALQERIAGQGNGHAPQCDPPPPDGMSPRELEVLRRIAVGLSNREIGAELFISGHTVANHVRAILRKTGSANRTEAAAYAHRRGLAER